MFYRLPTTVDTMRTLCRALLGDEPSIVDHGAGRLLLGGKAQLLLVEREGAWRLHSATDSALLYDEEDLAGLCCDLLGLPRPDQDELRKRIHEAHAEGREDDETAAYKARLGEGIAIMGIARDMARRREAFTNETTP